jgi:protein-S-isoprenylcysteine O-methyltransferase Ste14
MFGLKLFVHIVLRVIVLFGLLLFLPAGTLHWPRLWWFIAVMAVMAPPGLLYAFRGNEGLFEERQKFPIQKGQPTSDKILVAALMLTVIASLISIPLDVFRFHLLPQPGTIVSYLGLFIYVAGWCIVMLAVKANRFAVPALKLQTDRQQIVVDTGLYSMVRHPMYAGAILMMLGLPLWLGSYPAALVALPPSAVFAVRPVFEGRFLERELKGYTEYERRVRYRLVPWVW